MLCHVFGSCCIIYQAIILTQVAGQENCTTGFYFDRDLGGICLPCSSCNYFSLQIKACTATTDTVCVTCTGSFKQKHPECKRCPPCRGGHFLISPCTSQSANKCQRCWKGTYNAKRSYSTLCLPCNDCRGMNREVVRPCRRHTDSVCGNCKKGYYEIPGLETCLRCRKCTPGRQIVKACQNMGNGRVCGALQRARTHNNLYFVRYIETGNSSSSSNSSSTSLMADDIHSTSSMTNASHSVQPTKQTYGPNKDTLDVTISLSVVPVCILLFLSFLVLILLVIHRRRKTTSRSSKVPRKLHETLGSLLLKREIDKSDITTFQHWTIRK